MNTRCGKLDLTLMRGLAFGVTIQLVEDDGTTPVDCTGLTPRAQARKLPTGAVTIEFAPYWTDQAHGILRIEKTMAAVMALAVNVNEWDLVLENDGTGERTDRLLAGSAAVTNGDTRP